MGSLAVRAVADARDLPEPAVEGVIPVLRTRVRPEGGCRWRFTEIHPGSDMALSPAAVDRAATRPALVQTLVSGKTN